MQDLELAELASRGGLTGTRLRRFIHEYLERTTRLHHPAYLAHQVAVPHPSGSLGSLVDGFTNNAMAIYEMGPAAAAIEYFLINWLLGKVGWKPAPTRRRRPMPRGTAAWARVRAPRWRAPYRARRTRARWAQKRPAGQRMPGGC